MKAGISHNLVLDDDPAIARIIERATKNLSVSFCSLPALLPSLGNLKPLACFVDIHLGARESGLAVIPILRSQWPHVPILVMTSDEAPGSIEEALAAGADDFLKKPIQSSELCARLQARLEDKARQLLRSTLRVGDLSLSPTHQRLTGRGKTVYLSPTTSNLLGCLMELKGTTVKRDLLKRKVWGRLTLSDNALDRKVYEVREALKQLGSAVQIQCVHGAGYRLRLAVETDNETSRNALGAEVDSSVTVISRIRPSAPGPEGMSSSIRVLLIEDFAADAVLVREALRKGDGIHSFDLKRCETLGEGLAVLGRGGVDIVLLDLTLPDSSGVDTFQQFLVHTPNVPVVILSGSSDAKLANQMVILGAQDFLSKDEIRPVTLSKTIRYALSRFRVGVLEKSALRENQDQLKKLSELKSQFLANMSHEIRTPMNAVIGMTSLLHLTTLNPEQRECVDTIRAASETLLHVINDILDFSKIQSGKVRLEKTEFDLRPLVEEVIDLFCLPAGDKDVYLFQSVDPKLPIRIVGDPTRLRQVLANVVGNAVKFTTKGSVSIYASATPDGSRIKFEIKDTGEGIREQERPRLFEVFNQASLSTTKKFGGTGLGLAISKQLIELMKGKIDFESTFGKGTTFFFEVPLEAGDHKEFTPRPSLTDRVALVFNIDKGQSDFICDQLICRGISVEHVESEESLFARLSNKTAPRPDLILIGGLGEETAGALMAKMERLADPVSPVLWLIPKRGASASVWEGRNILAYPYRQSKFYEQVSQLLSSTNGMKAAQKGAETNAPSPIALQHPVLVAEDNPVNQRVIQRLLGKLGISADFVSNGLEALQVVEKGKYSAVLMDCSMPEMDGWTATEEMRKRGFGLPIIAMTANAFKEDKERCLASGMNEYLAKPVRIEDLDAVFRKLSAPDFAEPSKIFNLKRMQELNSAEDAEDMGFIRELMQLFLETAPATFLQIQSVLEAGDCGRITSQSHRLKGLALNVGAERLAEICGRLEALGRESNAESARSLGPSLSSIWNNLVITLKEKLAV